VPFSQFRCIFTREKTRSSSEIPAQVSQIRIEEVVESTSKRAASTSGGEYDSDSRTEDLIKDRRSAVAQMPDRMPPVAVPASTYQMDILTLMAGLLL
jgi:hypothetical protein